jgi:hypothetical protein
MKNQELKKMSLANIENRLTLEEMENVMAGSGGAFGWGNTYSYGCINGQEAFFRDYNVFWIGVNTQWVATISC